MIGVERRGHASGRGRGPDRGRKKVRALSHGMYQVGRVVGAAVLASAGSRLGQTELAKAFLDGAESLAQAAVSAR